MLKVRKNDNLDVSSIKSVLKNMCTVDKILKNEVGAVSWSVGDDRIYFTDKTGINKPASPYIEKSCEDSIVQCYNAVIDFVSKNTEFYLENNAFIAFIKAEQGRLCVHFTSGQTGRYARGEAIIDGKQLELLLVKWTKENGIDEVAKSLYVQSAEEDGMAEGVYNIVVRSKEDLGYIIDLRVSEDDLLSSVSAELEEIQFKGDNAIAVYRSDAFGKFFKNCSLQGRCFNTSFKGMVLEE